MRHPVDYAPSQDFGDNPTSILPASHWIIQQFGNYQPDGHTGTDYPCPVGTPVRAVADGTVLHAGFYGGTYADNPYWISPGFAGYCYVVDHGAFIGIYGHCRDGGALVHAGQRVTEGQILGPSGNTGASTGPHLHFEVLPDGYVLNSFMYGRINPARLFAGITPQGTTTTPVSEEDFMGGTIDAQQAEDIAQRAADLVFEKLDNKLRINALQAESIVQAATDRTTEAVDARNSGKQIDRQQADDIARAAAQYNQERDGALYAKEAK